MLHRITLLGAVLVVILIAAVDTAVWAHHSYLLTVSQLRAGLQKAGSPDRKGFFLIDVRSSEEHATGMIPGTDMNIDFHDITARHRDIGAKPEDHIVVYCQSGHRSNIAAEALADLGYRNVYNVTGSMNAWVEAGYPVQPPRRR